ncbi:MAG: hypothetical protein QE271_12510 [Bacteriovoracaceae bacterium]|nr:hypothetical protein [Bacteriovoracaceae bacterium]
MSLFFLTNFFGCSPKNQRNFKIVPNNPLTFSSSEQTSPIQEVDLREDASEASTSLESAADQERLNNETSRLEESRKSREHHDDEVIVNSLDLREQEYLRKLEKANEQQNQQKNQLDYSDSQKSKVEVDAKKNFEIEDTKKIQVKKDLEKQAMDKKTQDQEEKKIQAKTMADKKKEEDRLKEAEAERQAKEKKARDEKNELDKINKKRTSELNKQKEQQKQKQIEKQKQQQQKEEAEKKAKDEREAQEQREIAEKAEKVAKEAEEAKNDTNLETTPTHEEEWEEISKEFVNNCSTRAADDQQIGSKIRVKKFSKQSSFQISYQQKTNFDYGAGLGENSIKKNFIRETLSSFPDASFIGNGPLFDTGGRPLGWLKSGGVDISKIDCTKFRADLQKLLTRNLDNYQLDNGVFVKYHPISKTSTNGVDENEWNYDIFPTSEFCAVIYSDPTITNAVKENFPIQSLNQVDFAIQSGPIVIYQGIKRKSIVNFNKGNNYRSFIGVSADYDPLVIEVEGKIGLSCLASYIEEEFLGGTKKIAVRKLMHLDSNITDAYFREEDDSFSGFSIPNLSAEAATAIVITE